MEVIKIGFHSVYCGGQFRHGSAGSLAIQGYSCRGPRLSSAD